MTNGANSHAALKFPDIKDKVGVVYIYKRDPQTQQFNQIFQELRPDELTSSVSSLFGWSIAFNGEVRHNLFKYCLCHAIGSPCSHIEFQLITIM